MSTIKIGGAGNLLKIDIDLFIVIIYNY